MKDMPELTYETIKRIEDMSWFTHAQIFDDLLVVAQKETACFIWKTSDGLILFDGIWPDEKVFQEIQAAIYDAGWSNIGLSKFIITHGHIDHVGCGKWVVEHDGAATYLSEDDDILRLNTASEDNRSDCWKEFDINFYLHDGDEINCGDKRVKVIHTPGHTRGCMSFFFPVSENGEHHMAALFGGATPPWNDAKGGETQKQSIEKFKEAAKRFHADVALTNHTAFDNGLERIAYSKARMAHLPNIYLLGEKGVQTFCEVFCKVAE